MGKVIKLKNRSDRDDTLVQLTDGRIMSVHCVVDKEDCDCLRKIHDRHIKNITIENVHLLKDVSDETEGVELSQEEVDSIHEEIDSAIEESNN